MEPGRRAEVADILSDLDGQTRLTAATGIVRSTTLARAITAQGAEAERALEEARRLSSAAPPWYLARVELAFGSWLRREGRMSESRRPLGTAQAIFAALGAGAWSERAQQELAATGQRARRRDPDAWALLSAQELQITRLAAEGLSNREIGERLYLSHRTVGSHLYRAFPKLGVRSRSELHIALAEVTPTQLG